MLGGRGAAIVAAGLALAVVLAGCTGGSVAPDPAPSASGTAGANPTTPSAKFYPHGTAEQNKAFFDHTNETLVAKKSMPGGTAVINNLVSAGFPVRAMQVTPDKTSIGLDAEAIYFSVKIKGQCLIGQIGASFGYHSMVASPISTGACLIGTTRAIDWDPQQ